MEMGKLGGRKYRKQFLNKKDKGGDRKSEWHRDVESRCWPWSRMTNTPEDLDEQVDGLVIGVWSSSVRLDANAVRSGRLCHSHSLLGHCGLFFLPTLLLCVRALIFRGRGLHQPHILTVFFHPREKIMLVSHVSWAPRMRYHLPLPWATVNLASQKGHYQRSLGVVSVGT